MKSFLALVSLVQTALAAYSPFQVNPLSTHQPNGNPDGQVNYYRIAFTVESTNSANDSSSSAQCASFWGDNSFGQQEAYSVEVPTGSWIECGSSDFSFQLYPYFSIGNFTLGVQQNFTNALGDQITASGTLQITNTTSAYTCTINPEEVQYEQHAQGDCSIPSDGTAFSIPITTSTSSAVCTGNITTSFESALNTTYGQNILLIGSIPELGNWDPSDAIMMTGHYNGPDAWPTFTASVDIPAGTSFEYKYIFQDTDGTETWEAGENREVSLPNYTCAAVTVGGTPDDFKTGGTSVL